MKMSDEELYQYSKSLDMLVHLVKKLKNSYVYRYSKLIDGSELGMNCRFAKATKKALPEEDEEFLELLLTIRQVSDLHENKYREEILNDKEVKKTKTKRRKRPCCK